MTTQSSFVVPATVARWELHPDYVTACRVNYQPGDLLAYTPAHAGSTAADDTSFKFGLSRWNENNLPNIMYQIWPCKAWETFKKSKRPDPVLDAQGRPMKELHPREESPDADTWAHIATDTPAWLLELWTRLDPRLQWEDIDMRMRNFGQRKVLEHGKFKNSRLNNKTGDYRKAHQMISWRDRLVDTDSKARGSVLAKLSRAQVIANSTRPLLSPTPTITTVAQITGTASSVAQAGTNIVSRRFAVQSNPKKRKSSSPLDDETADEETKTAKRTRTTNELQTSQVPKTASSRGTKRQIDADDDVVNAKRVRYSKDKETKDSPPAASCNHPLHTTKPTTKPKHVLKVREDRRRRVAPKVTSAEILGRPIPYFANSSPLSLHYTFDPRTNSFWANDLMQGTAVETIDQPLVADNQVEFGLDLNEIIEAEHNPPVWQPFYSDPTSWSSEWKSFIIDHDAEPILKAHALDEF